MILYLSILFDRPLNKYKDCHPSVGGYEVMTTDGKTYGFDFNDYDTGFQKDNPCILECRGKDEDYDTFPKIKELRTKLSQIKAITECHIDMDDYPEQDMPQPVAILEFIIQNTIHEDDDHTSNENVTVIPSAFPHSDYAYFKLHDNVCASYVFNALHQVKSIHVSFTFDIDIDVSDINPNYTDKIGLAKELARRELYDMFQQETITDDDMNIISSSTELS